MDTHNAVKLVDDELAKHNIFLMNSARAWPSSLYYGRYRPDLLRIRVSDHPTANPRSPMEISIFIQDEATEPELTEKVRTVVKQFSEAEDALAREDGIL